LFLFSSEKEAQRVLEGGEGRGNWGREKGKERTFTFFVFLKPLFIFAKRRRGIS